MGNKPIIVLTLPETARDLLDTRGHIYSSRPESYISDISSGRLHFADMAKTNPVSRLQQYNEPWKTCHRLFANHLNTKAAARYRSHLDLENK
ncbi:uncharacterized protein PG998_013110 [Apiospora kogelbergensis]|uniref:uncharacterized protein n=1 Tax=Apiospora kogelbergensis TaxID=1337665 RepID=UPI00312F4D45